MGALLAVAERKTGRQASLEGALRDTYDIGMGGPVRPLGLTVGSPLQISSRVLRQRKFVQQPPGHGGRCSGNQQNSVDVRAHRQACPELPLRLLGCSTTAEPSLTDGQVRYDRVMGAAVGRIARKCAPDGSSEITEGLSGIGIEPQNVVVELGCAAEAAAEGADRPYGRANGCNDAGVFCTRRLDEGVQHGDMRGHPP
jgi:hypothetical protein